MLISVITPNYNSGPYLLKAVQSVLNQTYQNWELLIVDDCSTDKSIDAITPMLSDARIKVIRNPRNLGPVGTRNKGIEAASGEIIAFLDSDDCWDEEKLMKQMTVYQKYPQQAIVFSNYRRISGDDLSTAKDVRAPQMVGYQDLLKSNCIGCCTATYNCVLLGKQYFVNRGHEDYILWLSILKKGHTALNQGEVLATYRVQSGSLSSNKFKAAKWQWEIYRKVEKLNIFMSAKFFVQYAIAALKKRK